MAVKITIHRGTNQIGGTITEIATENTHIFVDFGAELSPAEGKSTDDKMVEMMKEKVKNGNCDAILFTHYHGDHVGLMNRIPEIEKATGKTISKLRIGATARNVMKTIHNTLKDVNYKDKTKEENEEQKKIHRDVLAVLNADDRWLNKEDGKEFEVEDGKAFHIGEFEITPVSTDHSAFDSYMYIIEAEGKCVVHTGDFRTHGRRGADFFERLSEHLEDRKPDVLLIEGTMLSRLKDGEKTSEVKSEKWLKKEAVELLKKEEKEKNKCAFVVCSSTNVDNLISFHEAAKENGLKFYVNSYVYEQLKNYNKAFEQMKKGELKFELSSELNEEGNKEDAAICEINIYKQSLEKVQQMQENGFVMLITNPYKEYREFAEQFKAQKPILIYSMWDGYLKKGKPYKNDDYIKFTEMFKGSCYKLHTSGHAYKEDIEQMINTVCPSKAIIPIHTERKWDFSKLENIGKLSERVIMMEDGEVYDVDKGEREEKDEKYYEIAEKAVELLQTDNTNWVKRYGDYYKDIAESEEYVKKVCKCFDGALDPLTKYTSVGRVQKTKISNRGHGIVRIDLRAWGISVAELVVITKAIKDDIQKNSVKKLEDVWQYAEITFRKSAIDKIEGLLSEDKTEGYRAVAEKLFTGKKAGKSDNRKPRTFGWNTEKFESFAEVKPFLEYLKKCTLKKYEEHPFEAKLLSMMDKHSEELNEVKKLELCKLADQFYQLCTPLTASEAMYGRLEYSKDKNDKDKRGGGIDILARANGKLCVIELKDTYDINEPPRKAVKQAIAYAAFIIKLLRSDSGTDWYKNFMGKKSAVLPNTAITVNAVIAMPYPSNDYGNEKNVFAKKEKIIKVGNDEIHLHHIYFKYDRDKNKKGLLLSNFTTSLFVREEQ